MDPLEAKTVGWKTCFFVLEVFAQTKGIEINKNSSTLAMLDCGAARNTIHLYSLKVT